MTGGRGMSGRGTGSWSGTRRSFPPRTARAILARDRECQLRYDGCTGQAQEADHIVNHAEATRLGWPLQDIDDMGNGQAACRPCHALKTRSEQVRGSARRRAQARRPMPKHPGLM